MADYITIKVKRSQPAQGVEGCLHQPYDLPTEVAQELTIAAALTFIQENLDPSLAFFYSCELGRCRACLLEVNGKPTFACAESVKDGQVIGPLAHLPVIRDLVVRFLPSEVRYDETACTGCAACVKACPMDIFEMSETDKVAVVRDGRRAAFSGKGDVVDCIGCRRCSEACAANAIEVIHSAGFPNRRSQEE